MEINIPTEKLDEFKSFLAKKLYEETGILYSEDDIYICNKNGDNTLYGKTLINENLTSAYIFGDINLVNYNKSKITDIENVYGNIYVDSLSKVTSLGSLKNVYGEIFVEKTGLVDLGNLEYVGKTLNLYGMKIENFGNLKKVGGDLSLYHYKGEKIDSIEFVGRSVCADFSELKDLGKIKYIGNDAGFLMSQIESLGDLRFVGGSLDLERTSITSLGNVEYIWGDLNLRKSDLKDFGNLKYVGGRIFMSPKQMIRFRDKIVIKKDGIHFKNDPSYSKLDRDFYITMIKNDFDFKKALNLDNKEYEARNEIEPFSF